MPKPKRRNQRRKIYFSSFRGDRGGMKYEEKRVVVKLPYLRLKQTFQLQVSDNLSFQQIRWCSVGSAMGPFCITFRNLQQASGDQKDSLILA
jgi:hypothetical protein